MTKIHDKVQEFIKSMQDDHFTEDEMLEVSKILYTATTCEILNKSREKVLGHSLNTPDSFSR